MPGADIAWNPVWGDAIQAGVDGSWPIATHYHTIRTIWIAWQLHG